MTFSGEPCVVDMKLAEIKQTLYDVVAEIPEFDSKISLLKIRSMITPNNIKTSYTRYHLDKQNDTIKHTAEVTGVYRLSVFSAERFTVFTTYPWRHSADRFSGVTSVVLNSGTEETFILDPADSTLTSATYWWCLEFVAETNQLVTA